MIGPERLQVATHSLRETLQNTNFAPNRTLSNNVKMIELDMLGQDITAMRDMSLPVGAHALNILILDHETGKMKVGMPKVTTGKDVAFNWDINVYNDGLDKKKRQSGSLLCEMVAVNNDHDALSYIGSLLYEDGIVTAPASVMVINTEGVRMFFRGAKTSTQGIPENRRLMDQVKGSTLDDFAAWNDLRHFYVPHGKTIATPVMHFNKS